MDFLFIHVGYKPIRFVTVRKHGLLREETCRES